MQTKVTAMVGMFALLLCAGMTYAADFSDQLDALDKNQVYLIHCASGARSANAHDTMLGLGFHEVYNMLGGFNAFQVFPGAGPYIE